MSQFFTVTIQQHSQPNRSSFSLAARQNFVSVLQQNQSGINYRRRSLVEIDKRTGLVCKNQPIYTQVQWKVPKLMYVVLRTGYCVIMLGNAAILRRHIAKQRHIAKHCLSGVSLD